MHDARELKKHRKHFYQLRHLKFNSSLHLCIEILQLRCLQSRKTIISNVPILSHFCSAELQKRSKQPNFRPRFK